MTLKAILLTRSNDQFAAMVQALTDDELRAGTPEANVTIAVDFSTINYKDALALANKAPVVRKWPMVAGIDAAGSVMQSADPRFAPGTGTPVEGGLTIREAHLIMEMVADTGRVGSLELVETNPILDDGNRTGRLAAWLAGYREPALSVA